MKSKVIGIAGGSGSGKSSIINIIRNSINDNSITIIKHDDYYNDQSNIPFEDRLLTNYDHPNSVDNDLLIRHVKDLLNNKEVEKPIYDFKEHTRSNKTEKLKPTKIIIIEGILALENKDLRDLIDIKLFVDTDADVRFIRRLSRDITERGRTVDSVTKQYLETVKPMHEQFVEPSKKFADLIIPEGSSNTIAIDIILNKLEQIEGK